MSNVEFPKINVSAKADIQYLGGVWRAVLHEQLKKQYGADGDPRLMQQVEIIMEEVTKQTARKNRQLHWLHHGTPTGSRKMTWALALYFLNFLVARKDVRSCCTQH